MRRRRGVERRAHVRHRLALAATIGGDHDLPVRCRTVDVSSGGALVEAPTLLPDDVVVVLVLDPDEGTDGPDADGARRFIPMAGEVLDQVVDTRSGVVLARVAFRRMTAGGRARLDERLSAAGVSAR